MWSRKNKNKDKAKKINDSDSEEDSPAPVPKMTAEETARLSHPIESFDYDSFESRVVLQHEQEQTEEEIRMTRVGQWIMTALIGMSTAGVAIFILKGTNSLQHLKFNAVHWAIGQEKDGHQSPGFAFTVFASICCGYILIASFLVAKITPVAGGSGIPEIKCTLNGIKIPKVVRIKTLVVKAVGVLLSVSSGLPIGKEGPMIHSGAVVGAGLSQGKSSSFGLDTSFSKFSAFRNDREKRDFIACGAAAGVAAAFGSPIGGVLFSLEEGASFWHQYLTWRTFFCAMVSAFTMNMSLTYHLKEQTWGYLGSQAGTFSFGSFADTGKEYVAWEVAIFILMGIVGGLLGALFNGANTAITKFRMRFMKDWRLRIFEALVVATMVAAAQFWIPYYYGDCLPMELAKQSPTEEELERFYCEEGEFNNLASLWFVPYDSSIKQLLHFTSSHEAKVFGAFHLLWFFVPFMFLGCITYGVSVPSGLFIPAIVTGCAYGRLCFYFFEYLGIPLVASEGMYALVGAACFLGGAARMTISLTVIILECTGVMEWGLPLMVCLMAARWSGNFFNEGIYDIHIHLKKMPFMEYDPPFFSKFLRVENVMNRNIHTIEPLIQAGELYDILCDSNNSAYPVVEERDTTNPQARSLIFAGLILRKQLCVLLYRKDFFREKPAPFVRKPPGVSTFLYNQQYSLSYKDMEGLYPRFPPIESIQLSEEERDLWLDLTPYMNCTPFLIQEDTPLPRAFRLFRSLGLRHLVVVDALNQVKGTLTRKDFMPSHIKYSLAKLSEEEKAKVQWYFRRPRPLGTRSERDLMKNIYKVINTPRQVALQRDFEEEQKHGLLDNDDTTYDEAQDFYVGDKKLTTTPTPKRTASTPTPRKLNFKFPEDV